MRKISMFAATLCTGIANVRRFLQLYWAPGQRLCRGWTKYRARPHHVRHRSSQLREDAMDRRYILSLSAIAVAGLATPLSSAVGQQKSEKNMDAKTEESAGKCPVMGRAPTN